MPSKKKKNSYMQYIFQPIAFKLTSDMHSKLSPKINKKLIDQMFIKLEV